MAVGRAAILARAASPRRPAGRDHGPMHDDGKRFHRLAMVRLGGGGGGVRRYGLARLDEIALAHPPVRATASDRVGDDAGDDGAPPCEG